MLVGLLWLLYGELMRIIQVKENAMKLLEESVWMRVMAWMKAIVAQWYKWFSSVQLLSRVRLFATPWTAAHQASLSITNYQSLLNLTSTESLMPSNYLILSNPLLLLPSVFPSIRVFSSESVLHIRWPKYWSFSFSISPSNDWEHESVQY